MMTMVLIGQIILLQMMLGYERMLLVKSNIYSENLQTVKFGTESLSGLSVSVTTLVCEVGYVISSLQMSTPTLS